jgi:hypothetical protein
MPSLSWTIALGNECPDIVQFLNCCISQLFVGFAVELIRISFRDGTSIMAKMNIWMPLASNTQVKSIDQYRQNESRTELHEGGVNFVLGGRKPLILSIFRTVF